MKCSSHLKRVCLLSFVVFMVSMIASTVKAQSVQDPGFELQTSGSISSPWYVTGWGPGIDINLGNAHSGKNEAYIYKATPDNQWSAFNQDIAVIPYTNYVLSAWIRTSSNQVNGNGASGYLTAQVKNGSIINEVNFGDLTNYTQESVSFNSGLASAITLYAGYWASMKSGASWIQLDDVSVAPQANGAMIYVDCHYMGGNSTGSLSAPFTTIAQATSASTAGTTILVANGVYVESVYPKSGTAGFPITYRSINPQGAQIQASNSDGCFSLGARTTSYASGAHYIVIDGFDVADLIGQPDPNGPAFNATDTSHFDQGDYAGGINMGWSHHITVKNCRVHDCRFNGIGSGYSDYLDIEHNTVTNCATNSYLGPSGISLWKTTAYNSIIGIHNTVSGNLVYNNRETQTHHSDGNGIIIDTTAQDLGTVVENNIVFNNGGGGILLDGANNCTVRYNTLYHNSTDENLKYPEIFAHAVTWDTENPSVWNKPSQNCAIYGNILFAADFRNAIKLDPDCVNCTADHNLRCNSQSGDTVGTGDVSANPWFKNASIDPNAADFHLWAGSPAIGAGRGTTTNNTDYGGHIRSQPTTIGAYGP